MYLFSIREARIPTPHNSIESVCTFHLHHHVDAVNNLYYTSCTYEHKARGPAIHMQCGHGQWAYSYEGQQNTQSVTVVCSATQF